MASGDIKTRKLILFHLVIFFCILFFHYLCAGTIYFYKDENGVLHFTDMPDSSKYKPYISYYSLYSEQKLFEITKRISKRYNVDPYLIMAIMKIESNLDVYAVSSKGAQGLMQIMPSTQRDVGVYSPFDPEENIEGGIKYIKYLLDKYHNIELALAAYNAGPGCVDKFKGIPPFKETKRYVRLVLQEYKKLKKKRSNNNISKID